VRQSSARVEGFIEEATIRQISGASGSTYGVPAGLLVITVSGFRKWFKEKVAAETAFTELRLDVEHFRQLGLSHI
jgi:hypothetical protein